MSTSTPEQGKHCAAFAASARLTGAFVLLSSAMSLAEVQAACRLQSDLPEAYAGLVRPGAEHPPVVISSGLYADPTASFHGQILLGEDLLYHLPMFMTDPASHPHNFQVIMRVELPTEFSEMVRRFREDSAGGLYTVKPPVFAQRQLYDFPGHPHLAFFDNVEVFQHHFERSEPPPRRLFASSMTIEEIVLLRQLAPGREKPEELAYMAVRSGGETYLVHLLSAPPDFDHLLQVQVEGEWPEEALYMTFDDRDNDQAFRLRVGEEAVCTGDDLSLSLTVVAEVYCEAGELSQIFDTGFFQQSCPDP